MSATLILCKIKRGTWIIPAFGIIFEQTHNATWWSIYGTLEHKPIFSFSSYFEHSLIYTKFGNLCLYTLYRATAAYKTTSEKNFA